MKTIEETNRKKLTRKADSIANNVKYSMYYRMRRLARLVGGNGTERADYTEADHGEAPKGAQW